MQVLSRDRALTLSSAMGTLNLYGAADFAQQFQVQWQKEGYIDYTLPPQSEVLTGANVSTYLVMLLLSLRDILNDQFVLFGLTFLTSQTDVAQGSG